MNLNKSYFTNIARFVDKSFYDIETRKGNMNKRTNNDTLVLRLHSFKRDPQKRKKMEKLKNDKRTNTSRSPLPFPF